MNFRKFLLKRPETNYRFYQKNSLKNLPELEYCLSKILVYQSFESLDVYPKFLIFKLLNVSNKDALSIRKRLLRSAINKRNKELQHPSKELSLSVNVLSTHLSTIDLHPYKIYNIV